MSYTLYLKYKIPNKLDVIDDYLDAISEIFDVKISGYGNATQNIELTITVESIGGEQAAIDDTQAALKEAMPDAIANGCEVIKVDFLDVQEDEDY